MQRFRVTHLIIVLLAFTVFGASTEAKLSWYQTAHTPGANTWQVIKLEEIRLGQPAAEVEVPPTIVVEITEPVPDPIVPMAPPRIDPGSGPSVPQSHWFRPPPAFC